MTAIYGVEDLNNVDVGKYTVGAYANDHRIPKYFYCWTGYIVKHEFDDRSHSLTKNVLKSMIKKIAEVARASDKGCIIDFGETVWKSPEVKKVVAKIPAPIPELDEHVLDVFAQAIETILKDAGFTCNAGVKDGAMKIDLRWASPDIFALKKIIRTLPEEQQLIPNLYEMYKKGEFCDVTLQAEGREFKAHGLVLAAQSSVFRSMLLTPMKEGESRNIALDAKAKTVQQLLELLYSSKAVLVDATEQEFRDLIAVAHLYGLTNIANACERALPGFITADNVLDIYLFGKAREMKNTCDSCERFFSNHPEMKEHRFYLSAYSSEELDILQGLASLQPQIQKLKRKAEDDLESDRPVKLARTEVFDK